MQLETAIEPLAKFQPQQNRQVRDVALAACGMDTCPLRALFSTLSCGEHEDILNSPRTRTWTALYLLNNAFFFIDAFINITLGCNANAGKCTGSLQYLVNSSKPSSGWYSMVRKMLLIFSYGLN